MTVKELYDLVKDFGSEDVPLRIVITKPINSCRIEVQPESNVCIYHDEVIIYP